LKVKITKILGTTYLCSQFVNHDGTIVSDHPLYLFETDKENTWLGVMFSQSSNDFTAKFKDGKDITFMCCSNHKNEYPTRKVFQAEIYVINSGDKNLKYSEYQFNNYYYNKELLNALKNALNNNAIKSVHNADNKSNREDMNDILNELKLYVNETLNNGLNKYPTTPIFNTTYNEFKKISNDKHNKAENHRVWRGMK